MAKPTSFSQVIADAICTRLIKGETLTAICDEEGMPSVGVVRLWRHTNAAFAAQYEAAREAFAEAVFEEILEIADDGRNDWEERESRNGTYIALNKEAVQRSALRIRTREYMLSKLAPKRYGEKSQLDLTNSDGSLATMSDEAKAARLTAIHQAVQQRKAAAKAKPDDGSDLV